MQSASSSRSAGRGEVLGLLGVHPLRAADSLQLAAALIGTYDQPSAMDVVSLDDRLSEAARREGFRVLP